MTVNTVTFGDAMYSCSTFPAMTSAVTGIHAKFFSNNPGALRGPLAASSTRTSEMMGALLILAGCHLYGRFAARRSVFRNEARTLVELVEDPVDRVGDLVDHASQTPQTHFRLLQIEPIELSKRLSSMGREVQAHLSRVALYRNYLVVLNLNPTILWPARAAIGDVPFVVRLRRHDERRRHISARQRERRAGYLSLPVSELIKYVHV